MQPIERAGVFALIFLVVTVGAVVMWDKSPEEPAGGAVSGDASPNAQGRNKKERPLGQLEEEGARSVAKLPGPKEMLPTANPTKAGVPPAKTQTPGDAAAATSLVRESTEVARFAVPDETAEPVEPAPEPVDERDFGPEPKRAVETPPAPVAKAPERSASPALIHVVKAGETLSDIASARLGQAARWKEIADLNGVDPSKLHVGKTLRLPAGASTGASASSPEAASKPTAVAKAPSGATYRVQAGDSLWRIAERELGNGERWKEIASANPGLDANKLVAGITISLPAGRSAATSAQQPAKPTASAPKPAATTTVASASKAKKKGTVR